MGEKPVFIVKSGKMEKLEIEWKSFYISVKLSLIGTSILLLSQRK